MVEHGKKNIYEKERLHWNTAWMKTHGEHLEVVVNPDEALAYRRSKGTTPDIRECVRSEHVFTNAKKGEIAPDDLLTKIFGAADALVVAKALILKGELQISSEHRSQIREEKYNKILNKIQSYATDPTTGLPHPRQRIELGMEEAKIKVDEKRDVETQVQEIVKKLQPVMPIKLETVTLQMRVPAQYSQKLYGDLERYGTLKKTDWLNDGALLAWIELPAGLQNDLIDEFQSKSHGSVEIKKVDEHPIR